MNHILSRALWILVGALLIVAGVVCLAAPGITAAGLALFFGVVMLCSGIVDIAVYASGRNGMVGAGWFLVDGILTIVLSLFILCNQWFTLLTLPLIFGMWLFCAPGSIRSWAPWSCVRLECRVGAGSLALALCWPWWGSSLSSIQW